MSPIFRSSKSSSSGIWAIRSLRANPGRGVRTALLLTAVAIMPSAQTQQPALPGTPHDWSHHRLVFSAPRDAYQSAQFEEEPRYLHQKAYRRGAPAAVSGTRSLLERLNEAGLLTVGGMPPGALGGTPEARQGRKKPAGLWGQSLVGATATVGAGNFPAKYSFVNNAPSLTTNCACGSSPDYVVFNTSLAGATGQASIVAFDNLYSGTCTGTVPQTYWAYNTGGAISTSVALSNSGSQVAFIQSAGGVAYLVVLTWSAATNSITGTVASGNTNVTAVSSCTGATAGSPIYGAGIPQGATIVSCTGTTLVLSAAATANHSAETITFSNATAGAPAAPTAGSYPCTACTISVKFNNGKNDTISSPFYDYANDIVYVGDSSGNLHKFTPVFNGTPAEVLTGWPVTVSSNVLTSPVYDPTSRNVFVADSGGFLYSYPAAGGTLVKSSQLAATGSKGIVDSPIVDSTLGEVYVFVGQDGSTGTSNSCTNNTGCNGVFQFPVGFTAGTGTCVSTNGSSWTSGTSCGSESVFGVGTSSTVLYDGTFDQIYYTNSGASGNLWTCAATATPAPKLMNTPFSSGGFGATVSRANNVVNPLTSAAASCSAVTEIVNGSTDYIFLSVTAAGNPNTTGCGTGFSCVYSYNVTSTPSNGCSLPCLTPADGLAVAGGTSGIIVDNTGSGGGSQIYFSYLLPSAGRTFTGGVTNSSATVTAPLPTFTSADVGATITGTAIQSSTTITAVASATSATMSKTATATHSSEAIVITGAKGVGVQAGQTTLQ